MGPYNKSWFVAALAALLFVGMPACSSSNFAGSGASKGAGLTGKGSKNKGDDDASDGPDEPDSNDPNSPNYKGGNEGGGSGDEPGLGNNDGAAEGSDGNADEDDIGDPGSDDGENIAKLRHDATIVRHEKDNPFEMKIETVVKGKTKSTETLTFSDNGKNDPTVAKNVCRNNKDTCLKITFTNLAKDEQGHQETPGLTTCAWATETGNSARIDFDADGDEHSGIFDQGTCRAEDQDEALTITCPNSKKLQVQLCTGG